MPATCRIQSSIRFKKATRDLGLLLRCSDDFEKSYFIRLEPSRNRLVFDMWPRPVNETYHQVELERMVDLAAGTLVTLEVFMDGNMGVVYVNNKVAMNFRAYNLIEGNWGFFVTDGEARFSETVLQVLPST
ncbi:GH32 C-terminal domain-containing protein [Flavihumibacter sp. UBA7668]|uniref:GH32 C-terminal domain-containing protein n=1 Tax=Flavihumibacter sp. UBA7668 TaxID=1946542 RepID=UPI0025C356ED|nr:GH32 C-terminal domain-containing protein [Flavihumibacter sp. UBA7668]